MIKARLDTPYLRRKPKNNVYADTEVQHGVYPPDENLIGPTSLGRCPQEPQDHSRDWTDREDEHCCSSKFVRD